MNETILNATRASDRVRPQGRSKMKFTFAPQSEPLEGYTIVRPLAKGGFGEVYLAESTAGKEVALKLLRDNLEVELRGIRHCLNLKHANLVPIYDIKEDSDGDHWIVMEYVNGPTLAEILDKHPQGLPLNQVREMLSQITAGLDFLHDQGIVHRDLKPANIFEENGVLKIGDVGLSKYINASHHTQTQSVGTVSYMAPEVSRGKYGRELDLYSLGVMLYEMLSGSLPFQGATPGEVLMRHLTEHPDLSKVPDRFRPLLTKALAKEPKQRFSTAGRLLEAFDAALDGTDTPAEPIFDHEDPQERLRAEYRTHQTSSPETQHPVQKTAQRFGESVRDDLPFMGKIALAGVAGLVLIMFRGAGLVYIIPIGLFFAFWIGLFYLGYRLIDAILNYSSPTKATISKREREKVWKRCHRSTSVHLDPDVPHRLPLPRRLAELTTSLGLATIFSAIVSAILMWWGNLISTPPEAATLTLCLTLGSWALLTETKFLEGRRVSSVTRRLRMAIVGGIVGAAILWINSWLFMPLDFGSELQLDSLTRGLGSDRLLSLPGEPLSDFMLYFGLLFALRRWWWHTDSFRPARVRIASLLGTFLLAMILPIFVAFPFSWSVMIATSLSAVVQLSAAWCPPEERQHFVERKKSAGGEA